MNEGSTPGAVQQRPASGRRRVARASALELAAETLALATVAVAPLALGAVHLETTLALAAAGVVALGLLVAARPADGIRVGWLSLALGAVALVVGLQLVPLPLVFLRLVAPASAELVAYVLGDPSFHPLTLDLPATARELARAAGLAALLVVLQHRSWESQRPRKRALAAVAGAGLLVCLLGLGHLAVSAKSFLGLWAPSTQPAFLTSFGNVNHLSGYLGLTALLCLGFCAAAPKLLSRLLWGAGFAVAAAGAVLAGSRGGMVALAAGLVLLPLLGFRAEKRGASSDDEEAAAAARGAPRLVAVAALVLVALGGWIYAEMPNVSREVDSFAAVELGKDAKLEIARTALRALGSNWFAGLGRGAFGTAHARYLAEAWPVTFTHVENEPLQALVEFGLPLGGAFILALGLAWLGLARRGRSSWLEAGAAAAAFAILAHNLVDFSLQFAAGYALLVLLAVRPAHSRRRLRLAGAAAPAVVAAATLAVALGTGLALPGLEADTDRLLALSASPVSQEELEVAVRAALVKRPADYLPCEAAGSHALLAKGGAKNALGWLNRALTLNPHSARAHALAGEALARLGRREQALLELRTAASLGLPTMATVLARFPDSAAILAAAPLEPVPAAAAGWKLVGAGRLAEAVQVAQAAYEQSPTELPLLVLLHSTLSQLDRHDEALAVAAAYRAEHPVALAYALEAGSLLRLTRLDEARATYEAGLKAAPGDSNLVFGLGQLDLARKQPDAALVSFDRLDPKAAPYTLATWRLLRAHAFRAKGDEAKARDELRLGLRLQPERQDLMLTLADVYLAAGQVEDAAREVAPLPEGHAGAKALRERIEKRRAELAAMKRTLQGTGLQSP